MVLAFSEATAQAYYRITNGRFLYERMAIPVYEVDNDRCYKLKPNLSYTHKTNEYSVTYYTNSQGIRTDHRKEDIHLDKDESTYRILFLGPSLAFGWANDYENAYATIIGENLNVVGKKVEVMNLGTPAQPNGYQLCWLEKSGYRFNPDMIVQTVYGNSSYLETSCREPLKCPVIKDGYLYTSDPSLKMKLIDSAKQSAIVFYGWLFYQYFILQTNDNIGLGMELYESPAEELDSDDYESKANRFLEYTHFVRKALNKDIPIVFIYVPFSYVVRPEDVSRWRLIGFENPYKLRNASRRIGELLEEYDIPFVDPTDALISKDKEKRMFYFLDIHLTADGNRVVAEEAIPIIQELLDK